MVLHMNLVNFFHWLGNPNFKKLVVVVDDDDDDDDDDDEDGDIFLSCSWWMK